MEKEQKKRKEAENEADNLKQQLETEEKELDTKTKQVCMFYILTQLIICFQTPTCLLSVQLLCLSPSHFHNQVN